VAVVVQLVQVVQILVLLVVLVVVPLEILLPADQHQDHHSQELLEQHHLLDGDMLVDLPHLPDKKVVVVVDLEDLVLLYHLVMVVQAFNFQQHLEIHLS
jgi:hypothetical protein